MARGSQPYNEKKNKTWKWYWLFDLFLILSPFLYVVVQLLAVEVSGVLGKSDDMHWILCLVGVFHFCWSCPTNVLHKADELSFWKL